MSLRRNRPLQRLVRRQWHGPLRLVRESHSPIAQPRCRSRDHRLADLSTSPAVSPHRRKWCAGRRQFARRRCKHTLCQRTSEEPSRNPRLSVERFAVQAATTIGATCGIPADAGPNQFVYNVNAPECAGNMCMKPIVQPGATGPSNTTAFCTASCSQDSDCAGQNRDPGNPLDTRCARGFACGVLFVKGALCCQKFCICQDFLGPSGLMTPIACQGDAASSCNL
jgi:hypothetical protein